jgi:uncharacterized hydrophobic protein (TIGR00271 family)
MRLKKILDIESGTDKAGTIAQIKNDVYLRGANIFYLICSALLASVGLDTGSPAVIIGAMLISPLMSPILGIGLSLGIHDKSGFVISLREFLFSVGLSLLISTVYFLLTPLGNPTTEIISRVKPTLLDLFVAFFGGIAGIIAISRSKMASAIPGVAIATALMPPICTAGFGIATARMEYFFGAFYLFFINAVFISFSAYLVVRFLKFPLKNQEDNKRILKTKILIAFFITIVAVPSIYIFVDVIQDARNNRNLDKFVKEVIQFGDIKVIDWKYEIDKKGVNQLRVYAVGSQVTDINPDSLNTILPLYGIKNTNVNITKLSDENGIEYLKGELKNDILSTMKDIRNYKKSDSIALLQMIRTDSMKLVKTASEIKIFYPEIEEISFSGNELKKITSSDSTLASRMPVVFIKWNKSIKSKEINNADKNISLFLKSRLATDTLSIINLR